jgi:hypothetical protein
MFLHHLSWGSVDMLALQAELT